jgi:hypothetical protein
MVGQDLNVFEITPSRLWTLPRTCERFERVQTIAETEANMDIVGTYLLYLIISTGLTVVVGTGLARSGRAFLLDVFSGNDALARAVSRLLVLGFYLLSLGFVTLTMRAHGDIASARAGLQLLSVKIGQVLLVLGVLPLITLGALARTRRRSLARLGQQAGRVAVPALRAPQTSLRTAPAGMVQPGSLDVTPPQGGPAGTTQAVL